MKKNIYTVIVTYNGEKWISECINSLLNSSMDSSIVVVDNNSSDKTVDIILADFPSVTLLKQNKNLGFGKANNVGISYAMQDFPDYLFLINQDAFVDSLCIERLVESAKSDSDYYILSPLQTDYSGNRLEYYFQKFINYDFAMKFISDCVLGLKKDTIYNVEFIQAASWLIPVETIKKIGTFDELFFHYGEDDNYCQRIRYHNKKIGVVPTALIRHDSHKPVKAEVKKFSKKYYDNYKLSILYDFADINKEFSEVEITKECKKLKRMIVSSLFRLKFQETMGLLYQRRIFTKLIPEITLSRERNSKK